MCAVLIAASLLLSGLFWGWALQGGGTSLDPRSAARLFGWLCVACVAVALFFVLRRRTSYDRPSAALAAALATTLLTGAGMLYLSYFEWSSAAAAPASSSRVAMTTAREVAPPPLPIPASLPRSAHDSTSTKEAHGSVAKAAAVTKRVPVAKAAPAKPGVCSALEGLARHQCARCNGESGLFRFVCQENARAEYCAGRDGTERGCPWLRSAAMTD